MPCSIAVIWAARRRNRPKASLWTEPAQCISAGFTTSTNLPNLLAGQALSGETDGFVMKLTSTGQQVLFSTYVGGSLLDYVLAMAVDANQNIYVTGRSTSTNLPQIRWIPSRKCREKMTPSFAS